MKLNDLDKLVEAVELIMDVTGCDNTEVVEALGAWLLISEEDTGGILESMQ